MEAKECDLNKFSELFFLDKRLLKSLIKMGIKSPTRTQVMFMKEAVLGKDIIVEDATGTGKTLGYAIYSVHKTLGRLSGEGVSAPSFQSIILLPSVELCKQVEKCFHRLTKYSKKSISVASLCGATFNVQRSIIRSHPSILICTPAALMRHGKERVLSDASLLIVDEADLMFSHGYQSDVSNIFSTVASSCQRIVVSATFNTDVTSSIQTFLRNPVSVRSLEESRMKLIKQFYMVTKPRDKDVFLYAILKLKILKGKTLLFVNTINKCYRLKLLLEQFSIRAGVLNSELPGIARAHVLDNFNRGVFDYLIATDESISMSLKNDSANKLQQTKSDDATNERKKMNSSTGPGIARGIDIPNLQNVINFDMALDFSSYVHRIGRTGRGGDFGISLSFVSKEDIQHKTILQQIKNATHNYSGKYAFSELSAISFEKDEIDAFRYRVEDVRRAVTRTAVLEARRKELAIQLLNSQTLKQHYSDNSSEIHVIQQHGMMRRQARVIKHISHVPSYLVSNSKSNSSPAGRKRAGSMTTHLSSKRKKGTEKS